MALLRQDLELTAGCAYPGVDDDATWLFEDGDGVPIDMTGWTAKLQARRFTTDTATILALTHLDGITLGGTAGTIDLEVSAARTLAMGAGVYPYDLLLTPAAGNAFVFMSGVLRVDPLISRT